MRTYNNRRIVLLWGISIVCILLSVITTGYLSIIPLIIFAATLFIDHQNVSAVLLFALFPFANIFKLTPSSMSLFTICELLFVFKNIVKKGIDRTFFCTLLVIAAYFVVNSIRNLQALTIVKVLMAFTIVYYYRLSATRESVVAIGRLIAVGTILTLFFALNEQYSAAIIPYMDDLNYLIDTTGHATTTLRVSGFLGDPNYCAAMILLVESLLCVLYYYKGIRNDFWVYSAILIPLGFYTYSKSYILCTAAFAVMLVLFVLIPKYKKWAVVAIVGIGVVIYLIASGRIPLIQTVLMRFKSGSLLTGRDELEKVYWEYIFKNIRCLIIGNGITAGPFPGESRIVHNLYIELLYKVGVIGIPVYLAALFQSFGIRKIIIRKSLRKFVEYMPLLFFFVLFLFLAGTTNYALPFYYCIIYYGFNFSLLSSETICR